MLLPDLNGPRPLQPRRTGLRILSPLLRRMAPITASPLLFVLAFGPIPARAQETKEQSVAEAARQARAKKQETQKTSKRVYTEEDLKRQQILTPEDRAKLDAKRNDCAQKNNCSPAPSQNSPDALDANSESPATSLGEIARQYRRQKELRDQKQKELQALKPKQSEPFHLPFSTPALASPVLPARPATRPPAPPVLRPDSHSRVSRRDPFAAVPGGPAPRPEIPRTENSRRETLQSKLRPGVSAPRLPHVEIHPEVRANTDSRHRAIVPGQTLPEVSRKIFRYSPSTVRPINPAHPKILVHPAPPLLRRSVSPKKFALAVPTAIPPEPAEPTVPVLETVRPSIPSSTLPAKNIVSIQHGDSLWRLAHKALGSGKRWPELLAANPWIANPNEIRAGAKLVVPAVPSTPSAARSNLASSARIIKVRKGDTLWTLAKTHFGHASAWPCLAAANRSISDPDRILEGQEISVPSACASGAHHVLLPEYSPK